MGDKDGKKGEEKEQISKREEESLEESRNKLGGIKRHATRSLLSNLLDLI